MLIKNVQTTLVGKSATASALRYVLAHAPSLSQAVSNIFILIAVRSHHMEINFEIR